MRRNHTDTWRIKYTPDSICFVYRLIPVMEYMILVYFVTVIVVIIGATFCNKYIFVKVNRGIKILLCGHDIKNTHV